MTTITRCLIKVPLHWDPNPGEESRRGSSDRGEMMRNSEALTGNRSNGRSGDLEIRNAAPELLENSFCSINNRNSYGSNWCAEMWNAEGFTVGGTAGHVEEPECGGGELNPVTSGDWRRKYWSFFCFTFFLNRSPPTLVDLQSCPTFYHVNYVPSREKRFRSNDLFIFDWWMIKVLYK